MNESAEFDPQELGIKETSGSMDNSYRGIEESLTTLYNETVPTKQWPRRLLGGVKARQVRSKIKQIRSVFDTRFPEPAQQLRVADAADTFFRKLVASSDQFEQESIIRPFVKAFPENMIGALGDDATPETTAVMFQIGSNATDKQLEEELVPSTENKLGSIVSLLTKTLPQVIRNAGSSKEGLLKKLEAVSKSGTFWDIEDAAKYYATDFYEPSIDTQENIAELREQIEQLDPQSETSLSPFNAPERGAWNQNALLGSEDRPPTWRDMADMARATEEDDIEYGMTISQNPDDGATRIDFKSGTPDDIRNSGTHSGRKGIIFFHSHPSTTHGKELDAPLVSGGDFDATIFSDHGGKYFNVATVHGITFHTGMEGDNPPPYEIKNGDARYDVYTIESGKLANTYFSQTASFKNTTSETMQQIMEDNDPFVYSVYINATKKRHYFVHIPWGKIDGSVSLEQVCYGNGLQELVERIESLHKIPLAKNVHEGLSYVA